jgi:long-chain acyl-CoA synthetase
MRYQNLAQIIPGNAGRYGERTAYLYKSDGIYKPISFNEALKWVDCIAAGLAGIGVKRGEKVAMLSENRFEWTFSDYAILTLGAVNVPIYPSLLSAQVEYILKDSEAQIVLCSNSSQYDKIRNLRSPQGLIKKIIIFDPNEKTKDAVPLKDLCRNGEMFLKDHPDFLEKERAQTGADDLATIIYTSGTTGEPKGAMLTHGNFLSNVEGSLKHLDVDENDTFLSFLPLCHVFERMAGHFLAASVAATIAFAESIDAVAQNMGEVRPTIMTSVPRLYEKIYARILESVETGSGIKRKIFYWALGVGREYVRALMEKRPISKGLESKRKLAYKLVFSKLAERVGGKLRFFVSGGAPLAKEIAEFFAAAGLMIYEGYGLTETSPVIAVNKKDHYKFGTVGPIIPNIEVKIADDGEILTRGPHVMLGYFKKEEDTRESIDGDGWFYTGDIGFIDQDGFLTITDRKKNIIVTSGGKNIAPQPIENQLVTCRYIEQAMVIGDQRKFCTAVIVPKFETLQKWAQDMDLAFETNAELCVKGEIRDLIRKDIDEVNNNLASFETIKDFVIAPEPFSIESGELTPSLKIKRKVVMEKFKQEIEKLYQHNDR